MQYRSYNNGGNYFSLGILMFFMFGGFKILFIFLPLLLSLTPIFLLGYIGYKVTKTIFSNSTLNKSIHGSSKERLHFIELMIHLMAHAIRADGVVDQREIHAILAFFQQRLRVNARQIYWIQDLIQHALKKHYPINDLLSTMNNEFNSTEKQLCIELLVAVVVADQNIDQNELDLLNNVANQLGIDSSFYDHLINQYKKESTSDYDILGIQKSASKEEIKTAYKTLCKKYHLKQHQ